MLSELFALVYLSHSLVEFDKTRITALAQHASEKNKRLHISGYLCFKDGMFFQYLEGGKADVIHLMDEIEKDFRHEVLNLLHLGNLKERKFLGWDMRYLEDQELKGIQLEDTLSWIIQMSTDLMNSESIKKNIQEMIQQIVIMRKKKLIC